jgi:hypothetical protein
MQVDTCHHAAKAVFASNQTVQNLKNILGTYLKCKKDNEIQRQYGGIHGIYSRSKPEVQMYNHVMHKLETLSSKVVTDRRCERSNWEESLGLFRREAFAALYIENEIVRCFAKEIPDAPFALPPLDDNALGTRPKFSLTPRAKVPLPTTSDPLALLGQVRTVVLLDDSASMTWPGHSSWSEDYFSSVSGRCNESRWDQARRLLASVAPKVSKYNHHGIDLHFLNRPSFYTGLQSEFDVIQAFNQGSPTNGTPTGQRVNDILDGYMSTLRFYRDLMPLNLLVITDGESSDEETLHWAIEEHITKIIHRGYQAHQMGIEFVQVGDCRDATRHLEKLEEEVSRHHRNFKRDIVGVTPTTRVSNMNPELLLSISVSGINARLNGYMRRRGINV